MRKISDIVATPKHAVSRTIKETMPERALCFLQGAQKTSICTKLVEVGWSADEVRLGWDLLLGLSATPFMSVEAANPLAKAIEVCEEWSDGLAPRVRAHLTTTHPEVANQLFKDLEWGSGAAAALAVATFLKRLDDWQSTPPQIRIEVLELMKQVGLGPEQLTQAGKAVAVVKKATPTMPTQSDGAELERHRDEVLRKLHAWYSGWAEIARTLELTKRELIALGIAKRRRWQRDETPVPDVVVAPEPAETPEITPENPQLDLHPVD